MGSCHAATVLREDVREQIRKAHKDCGFTHLRFHGLFDDDMSVVFSPMMGFGESVISFYSIDNIFDFLLEAGMKPFEELGFMPKKGSMMPDPEIMQKMQDMSPEEIGDIRLQAEGNIP